MIAKRTGWPRVRRNIGYDRLAATQRRPAPAAMNRTPKITPTASGPPPALIARTIIASPRTSMASERSLVVAPCTRWPTLRPAAQARQGRALRRGAGTVAVLRVGMDDHAARAIGEHGLDRLAEHRAARARRQRQDDRLGAHLARLVDDHAPRLARTHLLVVAAHPPAALQPRLLDDRLRGELLLGHVGRDRRGRRHRDRDEHVDA